MLTLSKGQKNTVSIVGGILLLIASFMLGRYSISGTGGDPEAVRRELRAATETSATLTADNERLRKANTQLGIELEAASRANTESQQFTGAISDNNRTTGERLSEIEDIARNYKDLVRGIREGKPAQK